MEGRIEASEPVPPATVAAAACPEAPTSARVSVPRGVRVRDVMTRSPTCVRPDTPFGEILDLMLGRTISAVPVVDEADRLLGVVTQSDLLACGAVNGAGRCAADLMTLHPMTASPEDELAEVAARMAASGRKRLLVVQDGSLVGIVARRDLLRCLHRPGSQDGVDAGTRSEVTQEFKIIMADPAGWYDQRETHFWG
jgi:CBS-domain-containing membrane protein